LFTLPQTNLLARYAGRVHEPADPTENPGLFAASCFIKYNNGNDLRGNWTFYRLEKLILTRA
jgi:hypothetical protein